MSDEQVQTPEQVENAFYPDVESEPLEVPTDEAAKDDEPAEDAEESSDDNADDVEEEASDEDNNDDDESDSLIYEINGKDYTAQDIELLESGKLMQADYTKKTQVLANDRKEMDSNVVLLDEAITKTNDLAAQLEVLVGEDGEINWAELKEDDPDQYIEKKERADSRKSKLAEVKANNQTSNTPNKNVEAERVKIIEANSEWIKDEKPTDAYKKDMDSLDVFYKDNEWAQEQIDLVNSSSKLFKFVLDNARNGSDSKATDKKKASAKKKIIATPKSGKVKANIKHMSDEEKFYGTA